MVGRADERMDEWVIWWWHTSVALPACLGNLDLPLIGCVSLGNKADLAKSQYSHHTDCGYQEHLPNNVILRIIGYNAWKSSALISGYLARSNCSVNESGQFPKSSISRVIS